MTIFPTYLLTDGSKISFNHHSFIRSEEKNYILVHYKIDGETKPDVKHIVANPDKFMEIVRQYCITNGYKLSEEQF